MLKIQSDRVIIDGHEPTKEQCETMTLLANALAESESFKTVKYESGYAEFEKVGKADELRFISAVGDLKIYDASGQNVYTQMVYNGDLDMNVSLQGTKITFFGSSGHAFYPSMDATVNTANIAISYDGTYRGNVTKYEITLPYAPKKIRYFGGYNGEFADAAESYNVDVIINNGETITLSSENYSSAGGGAIQYYEEATTKVSVDLTTLPGWSSISDGSHSITIVAKAENYRDSEPSAAVSVEKAPQVYTDCITFTGESSDFTLAVGGAKEWDGTVEYSTDHNTWTTWDGTAVSSVDKKLYLRGSGNTKFYGSKGVNLTLSARAACSGNIQTLLEYSNPPTSIPASNCYRGVFNGCTNLTQAPELPATTLASNCYNSMFYGCTGLTQAPELPATTLASNCYISMFYGCTGLTQAPELPATTLATYCYSRMFYGCTGLTQAPELPATTLASNCYYAMFYGCTGLTQAPELPATTLASDCYYAMFYGCTGLTQAPELPATTLATYCYISMFYGCTGLTQAPELPATTLATYCYISMFENCTGLTQAPELPATTLATYCYSRMFYGCTSLKISTTQSSEYPTAWRIPSSGTISSTATDWSGNMLANTGGTFTSNPSINTTYYGAW